MKKVSVNQFNKGLNLDNNPVSVSNDSLIGALNATFITKNGNEVVLQNDMGNASVDKAQLPTGYVPLGAKEHGGIIYVASYNPLTDESQIGCFPSPQRNFATNSDKSLGFKNLCEYDGNTTYEQKIVKISDDNIIRPGDKFIITATESQIADFENYPQYIRLKVLIITSDNQSIDITDELIEPSGHFEHVKFVKNIENDIQDTDYTIYTNRTCGQLCLRAELVIPNRIELSYFSEYKKISDLFPNDYQTKINGWINWSINHDDSPITSDLITPDTFVTNLHVKVTPYDEYGNIFNQNVISGYESYVNITDGYMYNYLQSNQGDFYYLIYGESDNSIINFNYTPQYIYPPSQCLKTIYPLKKSEQIEFSLIGSGKVTFNTFRYFNDFDNNHLVLNYGLKFYQRNSDYELTDLYLELINLRDLNANNWNYDAQILTKKRIALNAENTYGTYTETIDYLMIDASQMSINNQTSSTIIIDAGQDKITAGQYYLARICAEVDGTTLYKGDWHALLTSEATNYLYNDGEQDMLNLTIPNTLELNYNVIENNEYTDNYIETITGNVNNYFTQSIPTGATDLQYEIKKSSNLICKHILTSELILPRFFPFHINDIQYTKTLGIGLSQSPVYQDNIITDGTYQPLTQTVRHCDSQVMHDNTFIYGGKNRLKYQNNNVTTGLQLTFTYDIYSQLISPFDNTMYSYSGLGPLFLPYINDLNDLNDLLGQTTTEVQKMINGQTRTYIFPTSMLYCIYEQPEVALGIHRNTSSIGIHNYIDANDELNSDTPDVINNALYPLVSNYDGYYYPKDHEISEFLKNYYNYPNLAIFSSCTYNNTSDSIFIGRPRTWINSYDMLLLKGIDGNLYLLGDIFTKEYALINFKSLFNTIYICKPNQQINFNYYTGDRNNYFATNDYYIQFSYDVEYNSTSILDIENYSSITPHILDSNDYLYLTEFKLNKENRTKHYTQIVNSNSINEKVNNFLNSNIILGYLAFDGENYIEYSINPSDNSQAPLNQEECYVLRNNGSNNYLVNSRIANLPSNDLRYKLVNAINNNYLILDNNQFVLNTNQIPKEIIPYCYGEGSTYQLNRIFDNCTNNIKLFT